MKRNVIFLTVLTVLTIAIMAGEFFYTSNFKKQASEMVDKCMTALTSDAIEGFDSFIAKHRFINNAFHPKDILDGITLGVKKIKSFVKNSALAEALAELECVRSLINNLS